MRPIRRCSIACFSTEIDATAFLGDFFLLPGPISRRQVGPRRIPSPLFMFAIYADMGISLGIQREGNK